VRDFICQFHPSILRGDCNHIPIDSAEAILKFWPILRATEAWHVYLTTAVQLWVSLTSISNGSCSCHEHTTNLATGASRLPVLDCGTTFYPGFGGRDSPSILLDNLWKLISLATEAPSDPLTYRRYINNCIYLSIYLSIYLVCLAQALDTSPAKPIRAIPLTHTSVTLPSHFWTLIVSGTRLRFWRLWYTTIAVPCTSESVQPVTSNPVRQHLRLDFIVLRTRTKFGDRAFSVAGPTVRNSLPESVRSAETLASFKRKLKTYLFNILL